MLIEEIKNIKSSACDLKKFGLAMAIALALIGGFILWRQKNYHWYFFVISALFLFLGLFVPVVLKPVHKLWMTLGIAIMGWFVTPVILITLFYLVLTPTALLMRMFGKDFLNIKFDKNSSESYWIPRQIDNSRKGDYERQF